MIERVLSPLLLLALVLLTYRSLVSSRTLCLWSSWMVFVFFGRAGWTSDVSTLATGRGCDFWDGSLTIRK